METTCCKNCAGIVPNEAFCNDWDCDCHIKPDWPLSKDTYTQGGSSVEITTAESIKETLGNKDTMLGIARKSTNDQREQMGLPPLDDTPTHWEKFDQIVTELVMRAHVEDKHLLKEGLNKILSAAQELVAQERKEAKREVVEFIKANCIETTKATKRQEYNHLTRETKDLPDATIYKLWDSTLEAALTDKK
jgi:hypothetical protein